MWKAQVSYEATLWKAYNLVKEHLYKQKAWLIKEHLYEKKA